MGPRAGGNTQATSAAASQKQNQVFLFREKRPVWPVLRIAFIKIKNCFNSLPMELAKPGILPCFFLYLRDCLELRAKYWISLSPRLVRKHIQR